MCAHSRCRGLSVCAGEAETMMVACQKPENLRTLHHLEAILAEECQFPVAVRNGRSVAYDGLLRILETLCHTVYIVLKMYVYALLDKCVGKGRRCLVVATDLVSLLIVVALESRHAYASSTYEVYRFHIYVRVSVTFDFVFLAALRVPSAVSGIPIGRASLQHPLPQS